MNANVVVFESGRSICPAQMPAELDPRRALSYPVSAPDLLGADRRTPCAAGYDARSHGWRWSGMAKRRDPNLVPDQGVECFEVRVVRSIDVDAQVVDEVEVTVPKGSDYPSLGEVLGSVEVAKLKIVGLYEDEDDEGED